MIIWGGTIVTLAEFKAGNGLRHTNVGIEENLFLVAPPEQGMSVDDYINHSCNPNLWLIDEITLVAKHDIQANEELTIDYAIELLDEAYVMKHPCNCGGANCRKTITGKDWQLPRVQELNKEHFSPFLSRRITKYLAELQNVAREDTE